MWKKIERVLDIIFVVVVWVFIVFALTSILGCLYLGLSVVIPKTKINFESYQMYLDHRGVKENFGSFFFEKELPNDAEDMQYYLRYRIARNITAYSVLLSENTYMDFRENRINSYVEKSDEWESCSLLYVLQGDERQYIDGFEWYDKKLNYMDNVLHYPEARQQYYFGVIMKINIVNGEGYTGIIANDSTREIIEFSAELPDGYGDEKQEPSSGDWGIIDVIMGVLSLLVIGGMFALDKKFNKKLKNESGKDQS